MSQLILQRALDDPFERPRAIDRVIAGIGQPGRRRLVEHQRHIAVGQHLAQPRQLDIDDHGHLPAGQTLEDQDFVQIIDKAIDGFTGQSDKLESAIGMLMIGRFYGWRVLMLIHSRDTIKKYEAILGIKDIRDVLPPTGVLSHRSAAWRVVQGTKNFWKAVRGEIAGVKSTLLERTL